MLWIAFYGVMAVTVAFVAAFLAKWMSEPGAPVREYPGVLATVAGLLWPVLVLGAAQGALIVALQSHFRDSQRPAAATDAADAPHYFAGQRPLAA